MFILVLPNSVFDQKIMQKNLNHFLDQKWLNFGKITSNARHPLVWGKWEKNPQGCDPDFMLLYYGGKTPMHKMKNSVGKILKKWPKCV